MSVPVVDDLRPGAPIQPLAEQASAVQLMLDLEAAGAVTLTALTIYDPNLPFEKAEALAAYFGSVTRRCSWYVGDLLLYAADIYGEMWPQLALATGLTEETLRFRMNVCQAIPAERRRVELSFTTHALVMRRRPEEQAYWLHEAATRGWGYVELRNALRAANERQARAQTEPLFDPDSTLVIEPPVDIAGLVDAARSLLRQAQVLEDGWVMVRAEDVARLHAALGEE